MLTGVRKSGCNYIFSDSFEFRRSQALAIGKGEALGIPHRIGLGDELDGPESADTRTLDMD